MSRALDNARKAIEKAAADVAKWEGKAFEATSQKAALESSAGDALLDDPTAEDRIGRDLDRLASQIRTSNTAAATARRRLADARRTALLAEADDEDAAAKAAEKERDKLQARVDDLLRQLEEIDGVPYTARTIDTILQEHRHAQGPGRLEWPVRRLDALSDRVLHHTVRAAVLRQTAESGRLPVLGVDLGERRPVGVIHQIAAEQIPDSAREFAEQSQVPA